MAVSRSRLLLAGQVLLLFGASWSSAQVVAPPNSPKIDLARTDRAIRLDGDLNDPAWIQATVISDLVQQRPRPGELTAFRTRVLLISDSGNLYIGFDCIDPEPARIAIHTYSRDGEMDGDDFVGLTLDTFGDRRSGYSFRVNAAGARQDGLIAGVDQYSTDWDGIWDARTKRTQTGWSAEIVIPIRSLGFRQKGQAWSIELERYVPREGRNFRWANTAIDGDITDFSRAGQLTGLEHLRQGAGWEFAPYITGRSVRAYFGGRHHAYQGDVGGEVTYRLTPQLAIVGTVNTDFAETEVDTRQINLTRFPLFFPEKRAFFSEGSSLFEFGYGLGGEAGKFIPFFSRRVGLVEGQQVPILGGVKLLGRAGRWGLALLDVQTSDSPVSRGANLFAARVTYDISSELRVGTVLTNGTPIGVGRNTLAGADAVWRTSRFRGDKNLIASGWIARVFDDRKDQRGSRMGHGAAVYYPNDRWYGSFEYNHFGDALDPALGFLPRRGVKTYSGSINFRPRPAPDGPFGGIRQFVFENSAFLARDASGRTQSFEGFISPVQFTTERGDYLSLGYIAGYEYLSEPFEISPGVTVPSAAYSNHTFETVLSSSGHRRWQGDVAVGNGTFYGGRLTRYVPGIRWTSRTGRLQLRTSADIANGRLPSGSFVQRLYQQGTDVAIHPNLVLSLYAQYDNQSSNLGTNNRLRWTIRPGRDLFVVWNRGWQHPIANRRGFLLPDTDYWAVKLRWTIRR